jgi:hypothetical protein
MEFNRSANYDWIFDCLLDTAGVVWRAFNAEEDHGG